jgi:hypothetical protein
VIGWLRECGPAGWGLLGGAIVVLGGLLRISRLRRANQDAKADRIAPWALFAGLALLAAAAETGRFDGVPHVTPKFDATFLVWVRVVMLRAVAGVVVLALAVPVARAASRWAGVARLGWPGGLALAPFGLGLLASSLRLHVACRDAVSELVEPEARLAILRDAIRDSELLLWAAVIVTLASALGLALALVHRLGTPAADPPDAC